MPIVGDDKGLRFAPFLVDPENYTAVSGGHVVFPKNGPPGKVLAYAQAYWNLYLSALQEKGLMHVYETKLRKAEDFRQQEAKRKQAPTPQSGRSSRLEREAEKE